MAKIEINIQDQEKWFSLIQDINCRIVQNFTQGAIAKYLGVSRKTIVDFEAKRKKEINKTLKQLK